MAETFEVYIFGDETGNFAEPLQKLCERQKGVLFLHFLEELKKVLREEVRRQPRHVRDQIPEFHDVLDLVKRYRELNSRNQILETTFTCVCQLASVISFFDGQPSHYFVPSNTVLVGLCTGLLSAAAVSSSQSSLDLIANALKAVKVAFRIGVKVHGVAQRLSRYHDDESSQSWSRLVVGAQKEASIAAVAHYNEEQGIPRANQVYVSAHSREVITISGPPASMKALLLKSEYFQQFKTVPLDIFGPFHASHLYNDTDVKEVLQPITETNTKFSPSIRIISGLTERTFPGVDADQFMTDVVGDILIRPLSFGVLTAVTEGAKESANRRCKVFSIGPSKALASFASALKAGTVLDVSVEGQLGTALPISEAQNTPGKIAVVGMAGRFPNSDNLESFWNVLEQGLDLHRRVPPDRFDIDAHYDPTGKKKNTSHTPYGCFIEEPGLFDPRFFNMSPREAYQTDPMGRLALVTAYEALEMSGFVPDRTPSSMLHRVGTFYGQTSDDWRQMNAAEKIDTYYIPGTIRAFATGRINYHFKFGGPSYNVDTACSSSFAAIQLACTSLLAKECDTAVAGGVNVMTTPDLFAGLSRAHFLSKTGSCKTFDDSADGFCRGDGVGTIVLKRLEDAEVDNDPILGVILGTATNHSCDAVSITQPHAPAQEFLYRKILKSSGVDPFDVSYVEMHGTGTQVGDGTEMKSITNVFAPRNQGRLPDQTLHLGALKANIGHGEASAGVASLIKTLLMLQRDAIPPHVGIKGTMNTTFPTDLEERGIRIAFKQTPWIQPSGGKRRAYLNNFGASGGNTGLLLEDPPRPTPGNSDPRTGFVISVSARSVWSLEQNIRKLLSYLEMNPGTSLPELGYTTTARRTHQQFRISFAVSSISEVKQALMSAQAKTIKPISMQPLRLSFVFTGQGSHYASLGKQLFDHSRQFRSDIMEFDRIGRNQGFPSILPLIDGTAVDVGSLSQVLLPLGQCCVQMALTRLWRAWGITPSTVVGHSLGEYAALNAAGVLSASDTIFLVGRRAQLLDKCCTAGTHTMLAIATSVDSAQRILEGENLEVACINGPRATVLSGLTEDMISYSKTFKAAGIKCILLPAAYAFHSAQVAVILEQFKGIASSITFGKPAIPVISSLLGDVVTDGGVFGPEYLARQAREAVNFMGAVTAAEAKGMVDKDVVWIEIGPAPVCSAFVKSCLGSETATAPSLRKQEDPWKTTSSTLSYLHSKGLDVDWEEVHREYESSHNVLPLPNYAFENKNYWLDYTNNWCLTKGEIAEAPPKRTSNRGFPTSSVQKLTREDFGTEITLVAESDLSDPGLNHAVTGHLVNGSALCPAAVYADIALTLAGYLHGKVNKTEEIGMNVRALEITKPLIAKGRDQKEQQILRITAAAERPLKLVKLSYNSVSPDGKLGDLHATCNVEFGDTKSWLADWSRLAYLFRSRIDFLAEGAKAGRYQKLNRKVAYEGFSSFVEYDKKYHGMKEVILDKKNFEATSILEFQTSEDEGDFQANPHFIDNISHLSGFILNGSGAVDTKRQVYISHGWESLQMARPLSGRKSYRNYVKMHPGQKQTMSGDVYVFDGEDMVALVGGVKFQAIPRSLIDKLLPPIKGGATHPTQPLASKNEAIAQTKPSKKPEIATQLDPMPSKTSHDVPKATLQPQYENSSIVNDCMGIVCEELGLELLELHDGASFTTVGLDSLMSLTITGRMREELDLDIPSSLFIDNSTIGEAKLAILALASGLPNASVPRDNVPAIVTASRLETVEDISTESATLSHSAEDVAEKLLGIISEELGMDHSELLEMDDFADVGIDSLMSLTITGRVREELELDIPTSFFTDYSGIREAKLAVSAFKGSNLTGVITPDSISKDSSTAASSETAASSPYHGSTSMSESDSEVQEKDKSCPSATSILLQGNPKTASKSLFLFPDGSGSAASYSAFPSIASDVCIFGLNCPFMKIPSGYTNGIEGVSTQYLAEIIRRQPSGPYYLGGWSAGGVLAYQVACMLLEAGEKVERLLLVDSPCPINLEPLPSSLLHFVDSLGLLGSQTTAPDWLFPHFEASVRNLAEFVPYPMDPDEAPKTSIIWARNGLLPDTGDQRYPRSRGEPKSVKFLLDDRSSLGSYGWEKLVGAENISIDTMEGNHFTMIREPEVSELAILLRRGLGV